MEQAEHDGIRGRDSKSKYIPEPFILSPRYRDPSFGSNIQRLDLLSHYE